MKAVQVLDRIEYKPECHHCYSEEEVIKAMKKYAKAKCKEQIELLKNHISKRDATIDDAPMPDFD